MIIASLFFFGFFFAFAGSITPSMLNMTALKISLDKDRRAANHYALGVSVIVVPQIVLAIILTKHITKNPKILETLDNIGIVIFIILSLYFYNESKKSKVKTTHQKTQKENPFLAGITLSLLNMFAIPFFISTIVLLDTFHLFSFEVMSLLFFILGAAIGTFYILYFYGKFAKKIQEKTGELIRDINLILSILTGLVAFFTLIKLFS